MAPAIEAPEASPTFSRAMRIYAGALTILAAVLLAGFLIANRSVDQPRLALIVAVLLALAAIFPIPGDHRIYYSLDTIIVVAATLTLQPVVAMLALGIGCVVGLAYRRRPLLGYFFNVSQTILQVAAGSTVLLASDWTYELDGFVDPWTILIAVLAGLAILVVNLTLLALAARFNDAVPFMAVLSDVLLISPRFFFTNYVAQIAGGILVGLLATIQPWLLILIIVPAITLYLSARDSINRHRRAEQERHFSQQALAEAQRLTRVGSWQWDIDRQQMTWSDTLRTMLDGNGQSHPPSFEAIFVATHPSDLERVEQAIAKALRQGGAFELEHRIINQSGEARTVVHRGEVVRDEFDGAARLLAAMHDITAFKELEAELSYLAYHDSLTGLPNRTMFVDELQKAIAGTTSQLAVLYFDLDFFKRINDALGHEQGDQILAWIGERLRSALPEDWLIARIGGDEFALLRHLESSTDAQATAEHLLTILRQPTVMGGSSYQTTASIGIYVVESDALSPTEILSRADLALYQAKRLGRDRIAFYEADLNRWAD